MLHPPPWSPNLSPNSNLLSYTSTIYSCEYALANKYSSWSSITINEKTSPLKINNLRACFDLRISESAITMLLKPQHDVIRLILHSIPLPMLKIQWKLNTTPTDSWWQCTFLQGFKSNSCVFNASNQSLMSVMGPQQIGDFWFVKESMSYDKITIIRCKILGSQGTIQRIFLSKMK